LGVGVVAVTVVTAIILGQIGPRAVPSPQRNTVKQTSKALSPLIKT
jgi:hypothetical protein